MSTTEGVFPPTGIVPNPEMGMELDPSHDSELEKRLLELETTERAASCHSRLQGGTAVAFLVCVLGIAVLAWIGAAL